MKEYVTLLLEVKGGKLEGVETLSKDIKKMLKYNATIYIYRGSRTKKYYIGQTVQFLERHKQHYSGNELKFNVADFNQVMVVYGELIDKNSLDDIESQLITYFKADRPKGRVGYDEEVINRTGGNTVIEYRTRESVASNVILPLWEDLYSMGWVKTPTLNELRTRALVKYSPIKVLTSEQMDLIKEVVSNPQKNYVINGDAGTGKTVLLTHMVAKVLRERKDAVVGVVVQPNWEKTGKEIFDIFGMKDDARLTVSTSTKLINSGKRFDIVIVDESHKLSRRGSKQRIEFNKVYDVHGYENCQSHLEILQKISTQVVLMYDVLQAIRPANVSRDEYAKLTSGYEHRFLRTQFRIQAPNGKSYTSEDYVNGIKWLLFKDTGLLNSDLTNFNPSFDKDVFRDRLPDAYFGYFDKEPLKNMIDWLQMDVNIYPEHVNRVLAGLVEDWRQSDGKDPSIMHFHEGNIHRRWNSTQTNWINSKDADAREQIGSVFAVQGIDLNKVGVLIGRDLKVVNGKLEVDPDNFYNVNGKFNLNDMKNAAFLFEFKLFVLNIYYVLLTRGIDGVRVGFWHNNDFKQYMIDTLEIS